MSDVILERRFDPPMTVDTLLSMAAEGAGCFGTHRVAWLGSLLSKDGARLVCRFSGPDAESARLALRQVGADIERLWPGTVHEAPQAVGLPNVVVERRFEDPVQLADIQAIEDAGAWCLETHRVKFVRTYFSFDRRRMLCLYRAPDAESVRRAQREAGMPVERVWACEFVVPPSSGSEPSSRR